MKIIYNSSGCKKCDVRCGTLGEHIDSEKFSNKLKEVNAKRLEEIKETLKQKKIKVEKILPPDQLEAIIVTGSDGRKENLPCASSVELIVYYNGELSEVDENILKDILGVAVLKFQQNTLHYQKGLIVDSLGVEVKNLSDDFKKIYYYEDDSNKLFPTRFLDGVLVGGNFDKYIVLWQKFIENLKNINLKKGFKDRRILPHKRISETGRQKYKGQEIVHFDLEKGVIYFSKTKFLEKGIKFGPLRYYQYKIAYLLMLFLKNKGKLSKEELEEIIKMDKSIKGKIEYLRDVIDGLPKAEGELKDFINFYYRALYIHLLMQRLFKDMKNNITEIAYELDPNDKNELKEQLDFANKVLKQLKLKNA